MWKELDMKSSENFDWFVNTMNKYTCKTTHHQTYSIEKMKNVFSQYRIKNENIKVFSYDDGNIKIIIGLMDYAEDKNKVWSFASESYGVETKDDLRKHTEIYFKFIRDYLVKNNKSMWISGVEWKYFKPSYRANFDDETFWDVIDTIGHQFTSFDLNPENKIEIMVK